MSKFKFRATRSQRKVDDKNKHSKVCLSEFATFDTFMLNLGIVPHISKIFDLYHRNLALADDI